MMEGSRTTHVVLPIDEYERLMLADIAREAERIMDDPNTKWIDADDYRAQRAASQLVTIRKERGMTQQQLANKLGMAQTQISRLERNPDRTTLRTLRRVAKALGVKIQSLV